jgi:hypothetical protein
MQVLVIQRVLPIIDFIDHQDRIYGMRQGLQGLALISGILIY